MNEGINTIWQMGQLEIESVVREVAKKVLNDPTVSKEVIKKRAYALKHMGTSYRNAGKKGRKNEKDPFNLEELAKNTDEMGKKEKQEKEKEKENSVKENQKQNAEPAPQSNNERPRAQWAKGAPSVPQGSKLGSAPAPTSSSPPSPPSSIDGLD